MRHIVEKQAELGPTEGPTATSTPISIRQTKKEHRRNIVRRAKLHVQYLLTGPKPI